MSIFEALMLICFGAAWPLSIYKSYTSKSVQGKSPYFLVVIILGYIFGIINKIIGRYDFVFYLYVLNLVMVSIDLALYFRNVRLIKKNDKLAATKE
ncbi:MAG: PQ-loop domain-containing transporter [Gudongella sp.]|nr:PQ-loop domain-containing transporter [Gudongella sp.]